MLPDLDPMEPNQNSFASDLKMLLKLSAVLFFVFSLVFCPSCSGIKGLRQEEDKTDNVSTAHRNTSIIIHPFASYVILIYCRYHEQILFSAGNVFGGPLM